MNEFVTLMIYSILGIAYYFAGLRVFNKGKRNIVNLDSGMLQLYAIITAIIGLGLTYWLFNTAIENVVSYLSCITIFPLMARGGLMDILDGRGQAGKKFNKILVISVAVIFALWLLNFLTGYSEITSISQYLPAGIVGLIGFWMIGNKDDGMTRWGYGMLAVSVLIIIMQMNLF